MDRKYIENEHLVDRYLSGDLTVREAREFEKYCLEHPDFLDSMPIPVRLKARLARRPLDESETGMFQAIPSTATRVALDAGDDGFDAAEEQAGFRSSYRGAGVSRVLVVAIAAALLAALGGLVVYAKRASSLSEQLQELQREAASTQMQAPGSVQNYRVQPVRGKPDQPTLVIGWPTPPHLLDLRIDVSEGKYTQFQVTIDKSDGTRVMQLRRIARDSNRELRLGLNSSAFGPGEYLLKIDGYTWRGQVEAVGWVSLGLE
ncbi:MAG: hypothetical protein ACREV5_12210 [Steroidobacter sp.]